MEEVTAQAFRRGYFLGKTWRSYLSPEVTAAPYIGCDEVRKMDYGSAMQGGEWKLPTEVSM